MGIYVLESASDSEYTLSKEELALVDMEDFYIELRADGTGETYMEDFVTFQWKDGSFYALTDPDTPAMTYTREGDLLTIEFDGMTMVFKRSDTKPEIDPDLLDGGDDEYDGDGWIDGTDEPDPPYTYDDGNTYADLGNTNWYGWFRMENYKNVPNRDYFDTDTYDCWGYIGESEDGSHYFEVYRDGMPDDPVITMWVNVYDDHIEPILDGYDWVLDQNITENDAYKFNLYPYNDSISLFMYDYEGEDGTACAVSFYMRLDGTEWNEELEELRPAMRSTRPPWPTNNDLIYLYKMGRALPADIGGSLWDLSELQWALLAALWPTSGRNTFIVKPCRLTCWLPAAGNARADAAPTQRAATTSLQTARSWPLPTASVP